MAKNKKNPAATNDTNKNSNGNPSQKTDNKTGTGTTNADDCR